MADEGPKGRVSSGIMKFARIFFGVITAPPHIRKIFSDAATRVREETARLDAQDPGWRQRMFDGPDSIVGFSKCLTEIATERGQVEEVRKWAKSLWSEETETKSEETT